MTGSSTAGAFSRADTSTQARVAFAHVTQSCLNTTQFQAKLASIQVVTSKVALAREKANVPS